MYRGARRPRVTHPTDPRRVASSSSTGCRDHQLGHLGQPRVSVGAHDGRWLLRGRRPHPVVRSRRARSRYSVAPEPDERRLGDVRRSRAVRTARGSGRGRRDLLATNWSESRDPLPCHQRSDIRHQRRSSHDGHERTRRRDRHGPPELRSTNRHHSSQGGEPDDDGCDDGPSTESGCSTTPGGRRRQPTSSRS